jgi:choline dehydrogenase-like flavoprotein
MLDDLRRLEDGAELETDLCVIGGGAAGIAIAHELLGARTEVIVLESGGLRRSAETESLNEGETAGLHSESLVAGRGRLLGGATDQWGGQCLRPDPDTFAERSWVEHSGWPFDVHVLEPYLRRAESFFRIEGEAYDERVWDGFGVERPAVDATRLLHRFSVWCPEPRLGRLYRDRLAQAANVRVLLHATATEILTTASGDRFDCVRAATPEGKTVRVRARACVLCVGAVENARLLLASTGVHAAGIGNGHDLVGRFFQDHPNGHAAVIGAGNVERLQELYALRYRGRVRYLPRLVLSPERQRSEEVLSCAAHPVFHFGEESGIEAARRLRRALARRQRPEQLGRELGRIVRDAGALASAAYQRIAHGGSTLTRPTMVTLQTHSEQAPNANSRVTLSARRDRLGVPLPKVDWRLTELDRRTTEVMVKAVGEEFRRLGLGEVRAEHWLADAGWTTRVHDSYHHMGTTRLGRDPRTSVVDADGQIHGLAGMFVAGSSVFPAAGYANPTLMIVALAIRLGDHLKGTLNELPRKAA